MRNDCIKFGAPDLENDECIACWENRPEIFYSCLMAEYEQIRPKRNNETDLADVSQSL